MPWPRSQEYNEAMQDPGFSFEDPELRAAAAVTNALGLPVPRSGNFADVYQLRSADGARSWAVKCFTRQVAGLRDRYRAISDHLARSKLPFTVGFDYLERGVRIGGEWYPVLKMDWVEGQTLDRFVTSHLDRPQLLGSLADNWVRMIQRLQGAEVTHADLQHGNVLLIPGQTEGRVSLALVDYDGMYLPALARVPSGEKGHAAYQHPERVATGYYGPEVDRFPALAVFTALKALQSRGRALWATHDRGDGLLFSAADFAAPAASKVLKDLWENGPDDARALAGRLVLAAAAPLAAVPPLAEVLNGTQARPLAPNELSAVDAALGVRRVAQARPIAPPPPPPESAHFRMLPPAGEPSTPSRATPATVPAVPPQAPKRAKTRPPADESGPTAQLVMTKAGGMSRQQVASGAAVGGGLAIVGLVFALAAGGSRPEKAEPTDSVEIAKTTPATPVAAPVPTPAAGIRELTTLTWDGFGDVWRVALDQRGARVAVLGQDGISRLVYDLANGAEAWDRRATGGRGIALSADGQRAATACDDGVRVWATDTGAEVDLFRSELSLPMMGVALSWDGSRAAFYSPVGAWVRGAGAAGELKTAGEQFPGVTGIALSADGTRVVATQVGAGNALRVWDADSGREGGPVALTEAALQLAVSGDGTRAACAFPTAVRLYDLASRREITSRTRGSSFVAMSADGTVVAGGEAAQPWVWNTTTGQEFPLPNGLEGLSGVAVSGDGTRVATAAGRTVKLWEVRFAGPGAPPGREKRR